MKYIKRFEFNEGDPQEGDYVICQEYNYTNDKNYTNFISFNIGIVSAIRNNLTTIGTRKPQCKYLIKYKNVPESISDIFNNNCRLFLRSEINYWSKDKEELEMILKANKFNI